MPSRGEALFAEFRLNRKIVVLLFPLLLVAAGLLGSGIVVQQAHALPVGVVCLTDPGNPLTNGAPPTGTACNNNAGTFPTTNQTFTGMSVTDVSTQTPGGQVQLRVAVEIANSSAINGFDIILTANSAVLKPFDADISGTVLTTISGSTLQILRKCIDGLPKVGGSCPAQAGAGTLELAASAQGGVGVTTAPTFGLLFTAEDGRAHV